MEKKTGKTLESLGRGAPMPATEPEPPEWQRMLDEIPRPFVPPRPPEPLDIKLESLRLLDDDALMKLLTGEVSHKSRPLGSGTKMAITAELMRRQSERAREPHLPSFRLAKIAAVAAVLGTILGAGGLLYTALKDLETDNPPAAAPLPTPLPPGSAPAVAPR